jgi:hypothetical protein
MLINPELLSELETITFALASVVFLFMSWKFYVLGKYVEKLEKKHQKANGKIEEQKAEFISANYATQR